MPMKKKDIGRIEYDYLNQVVEYLNGIDRFFVEDNIDPIALHKEVIQWYKQNLKGNDQCISAHNHTNNKLTFHRLKHLHPFIGFNSQQLDLDNLKDYARNLGASFESHSCSPFDAKKFIILANQEIASKKIRRLESKYQSFLTTEKGNFYITILVTIVILLLYCLTISGITPINVITPFMVTTGLIGLFFSEYTIFKNKHLNIQGKIWPSIYMNLLFAIFSILVITICHPPVLLTLGLFGSILPLTAQIYHQNIVKNSIFAAKIMTEDSEEVKTIIDDYNLSGLFRTCDDNQKVVLNNSAIKADAESKSLKTSS